MAALPKADLHLHQEVFPRLDRLIARRVGRAPYDWRAWAQQVMDETPPGLARLDRIFAPDATLGVDRSLDDDPEVFIARVEDILQEAVAAGAVYVEIRCGSDRLVALPDFMPLFREAERRAQRRYPRLRAEAIGYLRVLDDLALMRVEEQRLEACLRAARDGLGGIDFRVDPYDAETDPALWALVSRWAERAAEAGLGITIHAGEFSPAQLLPALGVPHVSRLGHAVYAAADEDLLEAVARSGVTVECSLTSNVVLGGAPSYEAHPIRRFVAHGIPVTLNTDLPVHLGTTIEREYAIAAALGFSAADLLAFTRNAVQAAFTSPERRAALLGGLH